MAAPQTAGSVGGSEFQAGPLHKVSAAIVVACNLLTERHVKAGQNSVIRSDDAGNPRRVYRAGRFAITLCDLAHTGVLSTNLVIDCNWLVRPIVQIN